MMRPPPRSTLIPYPTLFRSARGRAAPGGPATAGRRGPRAAAGSAPTGSAADHGLGPVRATTRGRVHREDRKSTRLNSSHANISYAVFCLKKKTYYLYYLHHD